MNRSVRKAIAVAAVCATALAGGVASNAAAMGQPGQSAGKAGTITQFGYKANVFGTKVGPTASCEQSRTPAVPRR